MVRRKKPVEAVLEDVVVHGRSAWTKIGMPANAPDGNYQLLTPVMVGTSTADQSHLAVHYGVKAIQTYVNNLYAVAGLKPAVNVDGIFAPSTANAVKVAQFVAGVGVDGIFGPKTATAFFWPTIKALAAQHKTKLTTVQLAQIIGGICHLESDFDPGAVGYVINNDLGLAQINLASNPGVNQAQAFDPHFALTYLTNRVVNAVNSFTNLDAAIESYNDPGSAQQWETTGKAPNSTAQQYVDLVKQWTP